MERPADQLVFVVRMWVQGGDNPAAREWRGLAQEVSSSARVYVAGARDIADFIDARLAEHSAIPPEGGEA
jgi:hypothetical protein